MHTLTADTPDDYRATLASHPRVLVDYYKDDCPACRMLALSLERFAGSAQAQGLVLLKVRMESVGEALFRALGLRQTPTLALVIDGEERERMAGFQTPAQIAAALARHMS